jgi:uncharacterized protein
MSQEQEHQEHQEQQREQQILATREFVKGELQSESSGHDWWHIYRVTELAKRIAKEEGADEFICELAALLHDLADEKISGNEEEGIKKVRDWLNTQEIEETMSTQIIHIISTMSFKGGNRPPMSTMEGQVVQDADRLDAIGAIGIARTFAYSGAKGQLIFDPELPPRTEMTYEDYRKGKSTAINHFYEKLLKLKDTMNTEFGRKLAMDRHRMMEEYLEMFYLEWEGKR